MPAQVVSFLQRRARPVSRDWSQDELAEFYRVEAALLQSGMRIETDRGVTDEGDPWFAFCRADDGETFIHFARIDGRYIIAGPAYEGVAQGYDFPELVRDLISRHPLVQPTLQRRNNTNIFMHPAALLIAVVGTAFFKTDAAKAAESSGEGDHKGEKRHVAGAAPATVPAPSLPGVAPQPAGQVTLDAVHTLSLVASAMAAMSPISALGASGGPFPALPERTGAPSDLPAAAEDKSLSSIEHGVPNLALDVAGAGAPTVHAVVESPAQIAAFGAFLSLTAVLQDLPKPEPVQSAGALASVLALLPAEAPRPAAQVEAAQLAMSAAPAKPAPAAASAAPAAAAVLVVDLSSAALPDVAAVRLVRDLGAGVNQDAVLKLDQLPSILAQLIAKGEHLETPALGITAPSLDIPHDLAITVPDHGGEAATPDASLPPPVESGGAVPVVAPTPAFDKASIDAIIADFVARTGNTEVAINGHDILIYDSRIMTDTVVQGMSGSVTFSFADGSSINLVGLAETLHAIGALH